MRNTHTHIFERKDAKQNTEEHSNNKRGAEMREQRQGQEQGEVVLGKLLGLGAQPSGCSLCLPIFRTCPSYHPSSSFF
jgi:hypothetical protein